MQAHRNVHTKHSLILTHGAHATAPRSQSTLIWGHHGLNTDSRQLIRLGQRLSLEWPTLQHPSDRNTCWAQIETNVTQA